MNKNLSSKSPTESHASRIATFQNLSYRDTGHAGPSTSRECRPRTNASAPTPKYNRAANLRLHKCAAQNKVKHREENPISLQEINDPKPSPSMIKHLKRSLELQADSKINIQSIPRCVSPVRTEDMPQMTSFLSRYRVKPVTDTTCYIVHVSKPCIRMPATETVKTQYVNLNPETMRISPNNSIRSDETEVELNNTNYHFHVTPILETKKSTTLKYALFTITLILMTILTFVITWRHYSRRLAEGHMEMEQDKSLYRDEYGLLRIKSSFWET